MTQGNYARPYVNQYPTLLTYQDLVDRLRDFSNAGSQSSQAQDYRIAVDEAYREVVNRHVWKYFNTQYTLVLNPAYTTGTVQYVNSNRTVTLAGGTFPSYANLCHIRIGTTYYEIISNPTNTTVVLSVANNPGVDISVDTPYVLYQAIYRLPSDYRGQFRWNVPTLLWANGYIEPEEWMNLMRRVAAGGNPRFWTILGDPQSIGSYAIGLWPYPTVQTTYGGIYQRKPRDLIVSGYDTPNYDFSSLSNPATIANSGAAVTGTSTNFTSRHLGCVLRFGTTTKNPTGTTGLYPYQEQRIITVVTDTTHVTLDSAPAATYTGVQYTISDSLDLSPGLLNAILDCAKFKYAINKPLEDRPLASLREHYRQSFTVAKETDAIALSGRYSSGVVYDRMHDHTYDNSP